MQRSVCLWPMRQVHEEPTGGDEGQARGARHLAIHRHAIADALPNVFIQLGSNALRQRDRCDAPWLCHSLARRSAKNLSSLTFIINIYELLLSVDSFNSLSCSWRTILLFLSSKKTIGITEDLQNAPKEDLRGQKEARHLPQPVSPWMQITCERLQQTNNVVRRLCYII